MAHREQIERLIAQSKDPVQQATLIVLSEVDRNVATHTETNIAVAGRLQSIDERLAKHIEKEEEQNDQWRDEHSAVKGAIKFMGWTFSTVFGVVGIAATTVGGMALYVWNGKMDSVAREVTRNDQQGEMIVLQGQMLRDLQRRIDAMEARK